ncbi:MAG: helix-turn-helix domain-containing protein [Planctomycetota bacterium]|nr:helix-turn-helix domain-containing protein [Planctomycetota bacterium]
MGKERATHDRGRLADLLRQLRVEANLRQVDLAAKLDEPQSYVSRYESAEQRLDLIELRRICKALRISLADLVERFERAT